ncbi:MAG: hypothetical protein PHY93_16225 [Bacteriovorax sp.]|nr:hypothetical protein [Bacteriovorax sp.]
MKKIVMSLALLSLFSCAHVSNEKNREIASLKKNAPTLIDEMVNTKDYNKIEELSDPKCSSEYHVKLHSYSYDGEDYGEEFMLFPRFGGDISVVLKQVNKGKIDIRQGGSYGNEWTQNRKIEANENSILVVITTKSSDYVETVTTTVSKISEGIEISMNDTSKGHAVPYGAGDKLHCTYAVKK